MMLLKKMLYEAAKMRDGVLLIGSATNPAAMHDCKIIKYPNEPRQKDYYLGFKTRQRLNTGSKVRWRIDAGHGKETAGKRSPFFNQGGKRVQFFEYDFNRRVVEYLFFLLENDGTMDFIELVPEHSVVGNFVRERTARMNKTYSRRDRGISIHSNAAETKDSNSWDKKRASGIEVWHFDNSRKGIPMAKVFLKELMIEFPDWRNRGLKATPSERRLYIVMNTICPMNLLELGFFTNFFQVKDLMKPETARRFARAIFKAMQFYERNVA